MRKRPDKWIGGCVWLWHDQAILTDGKTFSGYDMPEDAPRDAVRKFPKSKQGKRLDDGRLYDSCGEKGSDGIVFADLEPKPQFWRVKAAYKGE